MKRLILLAVAAILTAPLWAPKLATYLNAPEPQPTAVIVPGAIEAPDPLTTHKRRDPLAWPSGTMGPGGQVDKEFWRGQIQGRRPKKKVDNQYTGTDQ